MPPLRKKSTMGNRRKHGGPADFTVFIITGFAVVSGMSSVTLKHFTVFKTSETSFMYQKQWFGWLSNSLGAVVEVKMRVASRERESEYGEHDLALITC